MNDVKSAVRQLLRDWSLKRYLSTRPPSRVVILDADASIVQAMRTMAQSGIISAPAFERARHFWGFVDMRDFIQYLLSHGALNSARDDEEQLDLLQAAGPAAAESLRELNARNDGQLVFRAQHDMTLEQVLDEGFMAGQRVCHRVAVFDLVHDDDDGDDYGGTDAAAMADDGGGIRITNIISQSDMLRFVHKHAVALPHVYGMRISDIGLCSKSVICVPHDMPTINCFATMLRCDVSCVGVVSQHQGAMLLGCLSTADLRGIVPEFFDQLLLPVDDFLRRVVAGRGAVWRANVWGVRSPEALKDPYVACCSTDATLGEVIELLVEGRVHHVFVVDAARHPVSIITITDVLKTIT